MAQDNSRPRSSDVLAGRRGAGGLVAEHPRHRQLPLLVGPSTGDEKNTFRPDLEAVACCRIDDLRFGFESSFITPDAKIEFTRFAELRAARPNLVASIFGHADPVGSPEFNKTLSGRRAQTIYGLLTRDVGLWEHLFSTTVGGDAWGVQAIQHMLDAVGHHPGAFDGVIDDATIAAIRRFEADNGLRQRGNANAGVRAVLFAAYMDRICVDVAGVPFKLAKSDFLGQGVDQGGKADYQGCGDQNLTVLFSAAEAQTFSAALDKTERNRQNSSNRRVVIYLFRPGSRVDPRRWPCPRVDEGTGDCVKRFWSDAQARMKPTTKRREFLTNQDTFGCRFYHRLATRSPCEDVSVPSLPPLTAGRIPSLCSVGKTFPKPSSIPMLREVAKRTAKDADLRGLIVGHTDRTGADDMNFTLSRARAAAVRAFLLGDEAFFRTRFNTPDPVASWDWEEIQWMLSAIEIDGDPCYAGFVDGHCSDMTLAALQSFQLWVGIDATHECTEATLTKLISMYLGLVGPDRPIAAQIEILGGGSWHAPRTFGAPSVFIDEVLSSTDALPGFRRNEVFLGTGSFVPPTKGCASSRHASCSTYEAWCNAVVDTLHNPPEFTMTIRLVDLDGQPLSDLGVDILEYPTDEETLFASLKTTHHGLIRLSAQPGRYALRFTVGEQEQRAAFYIYADEVGGMTVRLSQFRSQLQQGVRDASAPRVDDENRKST